MLLRSNIYFCNFCSFYSEDSRVLGGHTKNKHEGQKKSRSPWKGTTKNSVLYKVVTKQARELYRFYYGPHQPINKLFLRRIKYMLF